jgi:hypothetical protein
MHFFLAILAYLILGAIIAAGIILMAAKGALWLLILGVVIFMALFVKYGCATH